MAREAAEAERLGLTNARSERLDAATLDGSAQFDLVMTFDAVHDQARPDLVLQLAEELPAFLRAAAGHRLFAAVWTAALTGMRRNELRGPARRR